VTVSGVQWLDVDIDCASAQSFKLPRKKTTNDLLIQAVAKHCVIPFFAVHLVGLPGFNSATRLFLPGLLLMIATSRHGGIMTETGRQSTIGNLSTDSAYDVFNHTEDFAGETSIGLQTTNRSRFSAAAGTKA